MSTTNKKTIKEVAIDVLKASNSKNGVTLPSLKKSIANRYGESDLTAGQKTILKKYLHAAMTDGTILKTEGFEGNLKGKFRLNKSKIVPEKKKKAAAGENKTKATPKPRVSAKAGAKKKVAKKPTKAAAKSADKPGEKLMKRKSGTNVTPKKKKPTTMKAAAAAKDPTPKKTASKVANRKKTPAKAASKPKKAAAAKAKKPAKAAA